MFQYKVDLYKNIQYYAISQLRQNKDYLNLCEVIAKQYDNIKVVSQYILNNLDIDIASGVWLDYIGWLVGSTRGYFDITKFFCVNGEHVNAEKYFYFPSQTVNGETSLTDDLFRNRIRAKIAYNTSRATRRENKYIIKNLVNAERVIIKRVEPMLLDITLIGDAINENFATRENIEQILGDGVGLRNINIGDK